MNQNFVQFRMLENLPFELLECGFDCLYNIGPTVVVKQHDFTFSVEPLQLTYFIYAVQLGNVELFVRTVFFKYLPMHYNLPVPPNRIIVFFGRRSCLTLDFGVSLGAIHSLLHVNMQVLFFPTAAPN